MKASRMRGGSIRVFLLASLGAHLSVLAALPREPAPPRPRAARPASAVDESAPLDVSVLPTWTDDPAGRMRTLLAWAEALAVARGPIEERIPLGPGAPTRTYAALDLARDGSGPGERRPLETRLTDRDDGISLSERLLNSLTESQVQRIHTAEDRATWDDRRATPNPGEGDIVSSPVFPGDEIARNESTSEPAAGDVGAEASSEGNVPRAAREGIFGVQGDGGEEPLAPRQAVAASLGRPGAADPDSPGHPDGDGARRADSEPLPAWQRPDVPQGHASVPAAVRGTRTRDNRNGRAWNRHFYRSYADAALVSGLADEGSGDGRIGTGRGLAGRGDGARAVGADAQGPTWISFRTGDPRYLGYFRQIHRKIDPLWRDAFPDALRLAHEQGTVIVGFLLHRDGRVTGLRILRRSGYPEFDRNVLAAVMSAAPFHPIPSEIAEDVLYVSAPFHFSNPMF